MPGQTRADAQVEAPAPAPVVLQPDELEDPLGDDDLPHDAIFNPYEMPDEDQGPPRPGLMTRAKQGLVDTGHAIAEGASNAWDATKKGAGEAWDATKAKGKALGQAVAHGAHEAWEGTKSGVKAIGHGLKDAAIATAESAQAGGVLGAAVGGLSGGALGGGVGALGGLAVGGPQEGALKTGAGVGAALVGAPSALVGGVVGAVTGPLVRAVDALRVDDKKLLAQTAGIPAFHVVLEQLAHHYAYGRGDIVQLRKFGYVIAKEHEDKNSGFRVISFNPVAPGTTDPDGKPLVPVVAFRGTANAGGAMDDANTEGVGTFQFSRNEKEIQGVVDAAGGPPKPIVTGHSLGGALAQLCAARFGGLVGDVVTFQSPGIQKTEADKIDKDEHQATHYRAKGDLVSDAGEAFAPGKLFTFEHKGPNSPLTHLTFPLAELNEIRRKHGFDAPIVDGTRSNDDEWKEAGQHHQGKWTADPATKNRLLKVRESEDVMQGPTTTVTDIISVGKGRPVSEAARAQAGAMTGISDRQSKYAAAWKEIREIAFTIVDPQMIPSIRGRVVDLILKHGVDPKDHGKFISQAEAAMVQALEGSPFFAGDPMT